MSAKSNPPYVLLHGAFRGPWAWDRVRPLLEEAGHDVFTPDLSSPDATLTSCIRVVEDVFSVNGLSRVRLAGHSQGGFIARAASQFLASSIEELIYLDAPIPSHGQRAFDFRPEGSPEPPLRRGDLVDPPQLSVGKGISAEDAEWINRRLVRQAAAISLEKVVLDDPDALALPERCVFFSLTPPGFPCELTRRALEKAGKPYSLLQAAHDAPVTDPTSVADWLLGRL